MCKIRVYAKNIKYFYTRNFSFSDFDPSKPLQINFSSFDKPNKLQKGFLLHNIHFFNKLIAIITTLFLTDVFRNKQLELCLEIYVFIFLLGSK